MHNPKKLLAGLLIGPFLSLGTALADTTVSMADIEKAFDREKYRAFKVFSHRDQNEDEIVYKRHPNKFGFIEKKLRLYTEALQDAQARAEAERLALVERLKKENASDSSLETSFEIDASSHWERPLSLADVTIGRDAVPFKMDSKQTAKVIKFLESNTTEGGMPLSYKMTKEDWKKWESPMDEVDDMMERLIIRYSVSIYDAAVWQIALAVTGYEKNKELVDDHTRRLLSGRSGLLQDIRAFDDPFRYGEKKLKMPRENAFFFRIIADEYLQTDPKTGLEELALFPNNRELHHEDWKPITGEQAWAAIIGPLQLAYLKYGKVIPLDSDEAVLALSILPAIEAMQSKIGAVYHAPEGTSGKDPHDISNENNFSVYAALKMLHELVKGRRLDLARRIQKVMEKQENYFRLYAFDKERGCFYQGGFYAEGRFIPTSIYAVDCQTWGTIVLGPAWIDKQFGEGMAFQIWQRAKKHAGYFDKRRILGGVGFTDGHRILSVEWTCGAILAARELADEYKTSHPIWAKACERDIVSMRREMEELKVDFEDDSTGYFYANKRSFIPFGWWANRIPSIVASSWVVLIDEGFNPFLLGGGKPRELNDKT